MNARINWGIPVYIFSLFVVILNLVFSYYLIVYFHPISLLFFIPALILDFIFYPVFRSLIFSIVKKTHYDLVISGKGIEINRKLHLWENIKSISFQTGRIVHNNTFFQGFKLPAMQKIYILDTEGKEYSAAIDIDYILKGNRGKNNLILAKAELYDLRKMGILSDWAEKR
jgi:hypothetical protein